MTIGNISVLQGIKAKMDYLTQRQTLISENIANANSPGYQPKDLKAADFSVLVDRVSGKGRGQVVQASTRPGHISGADNAVNPKVRQQSYAYDVQPSGNAVIIEEQIIKSNKTLMDYNLMTNLYQKNVGMIRMALGGTN